MTDITNNSELFQKVAVFKVDQWEEVLAGAIRAVINARIEEFGFEGEMKDGIAAGELYFAASACLRIAVFRAVGMKVGGERNLEALVPNGTVGHDIAGKLMAEVVVAIEEIVDRYFAEKAEAN